MIKYILPNIHNRNFRIYDLTRLETAYEKRYKKMLETFDSLTSMDGFEHSPIKLRIVNVLRLPRSTGANKLTSYRPRDLDDANKHPRWLRLRISTLFSTISPTCRITSPYCHRLIRLYSISRLAHPRVVAMALPASASLRLRNT